MTDVLAADASPSSRDATHRKIDEDLFELTLSRENKAELFEEAITELERGSLESASILENLAKWNPSDASRFVQRTASTILDTPFRLIYPTSARSSFDATSGLYARQYLAISYCWGLGDFLRTGYERHGSWPISKPFVEAILADKDHPREGIWMDQLCIDQTSSLDKGKSVAAMDIIYRSCIRLVILLEDVCLDEQEAKLHEEYDNTKRKFETKWVPGETERDVFISFYNKVNAARWWKRAWCLHEFSVNGPWTDKRQCNIIHNATFIVNGPGGSTVKIKWVNLHFIMANAFLGLAYLGPELDTEDRVLYYSSLLALARGEIYPLVILLDQLEKKPIIFDDKPTWLCRGVGQAHTSIPSFNLKNLQGIHRITTEDIELDMIFFKSPWELVTKENLRTTYTVFPSLIPTVQPAKYTPGKFADPTTSEWSDEDLDQCRRRFLAGCLMNGYAYIARLWEQLKRDVVVASYNDTIFKKLTPHPAFHDAAQELLRQLLPVSELLCIPPSSIFTLEDAHLFLTWLADPRSIYYIGAFTHRLQSTTPGSAQAFVNGLHPKQYTDKGPMNELELAVPIDLLGASCATFRVWILRPGKGETKGSKWRLVGKALLLGEPTLTNEGIPGAGTDETVVSVKRAVVTGWPEE
ncbi:hypothetical protein SNOG_02185 [Parastagonospora nodorum SN15]|uniref:Heterokaryon incompatibility domain-containing protein n=1 Tax=Phaeosphaeria nodorum (strain SN15 / ATCC MYA-4574 / FGSC 10173) TaxID=321614 RepID=Q0V1C9_PHANO|nr:hypothetical protein SNOG_02185 [Parastagonospora nodorum SN15]EAT90397.1 hypothetical protein SNOG_02185 [Parastagonospora nodorum SN15]